MAKYKVHFIYAQAHHAILVCLETGRNFLDIELEMSSQGCWLVKIIQFLPTYL